MSFTYQFNTTCAAVYGAQEAIFIHQIYFWCRVNEKNGRNLHDGRYWSYNSMKALREIFDFWTPSQLETVIKKLPEKGRDPDRELLHGPARPDAVLYNYGICEMHL